MRSEEGKLESVRERAARCSREGLLWHRRRAERFTSEEKRRMRSGLMRRRGEMWMEGSEGMRRVREQLPK